MWRLLGGVERKAPMSETVEECPWCSSKNISRKPSNFSYSSKKQEQTKKVGDLTDEFIENSKEDLKNQKKELDSSR